MSNTYQPESLHPYIMNDRLKKATGSGGITEIPIASADTVGGIMIGGSSNPITITGSGNASVRKATAELLGVVKAGDGVSINSDGAISVEGIDISGSSNTTLDTFNGKPVKISCLTLSITSATEDIPFAVDHNLNIDDFIDGKLCIKTSSGESAIDGNPIYLNSSGKIVIVPRSGWSNITSAKLWIKHTETLI